MRDKEKAAAWQKAWMLANPERNRAHSRAWAKANPEKVAMKQNRLRLRVQEKEAGGPKPATCEVCGGTGKICFDHCHNTGKFRGWLCGPCNIALGGARDSPATLRALAEYLEQHEKSNTRELRAA